MSIFQTPTWLKRPDAAERSPRRAEAFFEARNRGQLHQLLLSEYIASGMTQTELARRTGKRRETISRVLGHPTNLEINTASKILFALTGKAIRFVSYDPSEAPSKPTNRDHRPDWADRPVERPPTQESKNAAGTGNLSIEFKRSLEPA